MIALILNVAIWLGVMFLGWAIFGIDPTWQEVALIVIAGFIADLLVPVGGR